MIFFLEIDSSDEQINSDFVIIWANIFHGIQFIKIGENCFYSLFHVFKGILRKSKHIRENFCLYFNDYNCLRLTWIQWKQLNWQKVDLSFIKALTWKIFNNLVDRSNKPHFTQIFWAKHIHFKKKFKIINREQKFASDINHLKPIGT